jgi:hypothetical protein
LSFAILNLSKFIDESADINFKLLERERERERERVQELSFA